MLGTGTGISKGLNVSHRVLLSRSAALAAVRSSTRRSSRIVAANLQAKRQYSSSNDNNKGVNWRAAAGTTGNVLLIGSVLSLFGFIMYTLYDNLLAESGTTRVYNESLDLIRANPQIRSILGEGVLGFGEPTHSQRQRHRSIAHREFEDEQGRKRLTMQYYIRDGAYAIPYLGVVKVDLAQSKNTNAWDYNYIVVDVYPVDRSGFGEDWMQRTEKTGTPVRRIEVLVTDEFAAQVRLYEKQKRNQKFSTAGRGSYDGTWFSVLRPGNWRK